jgi:hypothetical protein
MAQSICPFKIFNYASQTSSAKKIWRRMCEPEKEE